MDTLNIRWDTGVAFWVTNFFPKQLSLICMQNCLYFEKIGMAFRLQIVHFVYKTCILLTNRAFQITNLRFNYKSRISFYKCDFSDYNSAFFVHHSTFCSFLPLIFVIILVVIDYFCFSLLHFLHYQKTY